MACFDIGLQPTSVA